MLLKVRQVVERDGYTALFQKGLAHGRSRFIGILAYVYRRVVRPFLPVIRPVRYGSIAVALDVRWGDNALPKGFLPSQYQDQAWETGIMAGLETAVTTGDRVVVVGGGMGVTAAYSAMLVGPSGKVDCYEAGAGEVPKVMETARRNGVADRVTVHHAVVGEAISVIGGKAGPAIRASELPDCDVLQLDCEGSELGILAAMTVRPRVCIVETHGLLGAPTEIVRKSLERLDYRVVDIGLAEAGSEYCVKNDIRVLLAALNS